jgi:Xaa-Pro aminopeptidase
VVLKHRANPKVEYDGRLGNKSIYVLIYCAMWKPRVVLAIAVVGCFAAAQAENPSTMGRRQRALKEFHDGVLLLHASSMLDLTSDGFRQDPFFYYFTGLENTVGALLAIDGNRGESWLFLPSNPPYQKRGLQPEVQPGVEAAKRMGLEHVVDWSELESFLATRAGTSQYLYYAEDVPKFADLPSKLLSTKSPDAPSWLQIILQRWPAFEAKDASSRMENLMEVQDAEEMVALRMAAKSTVAAVMAGMHTIRPNASQRSVESVVAKTCWDQSAHGVAFWPWAMAGDNAVFPHPFFSMTRYDHLNQNMRSGDLVRLDVGCEWNHYTGDLGRTVPVSGHYDDGQRETWSIFVAAYHAGAQILREGVTIDQVFDAWRKELLSHRASAKTVLAQHAIDAWSDRKNIPFWQVHTTNLVAALPTEPLRAGTTINFEPIAAVDGQGFFLEDMYVITNNGAELLTPKVPYSAEDIEAAMR